MFVDVVVVVLEDYDWWRVVVQRRYIGQEEIKPAREENNTSVRQVGKSGASERTLDADVAVRSGRDEGAGHGEHVNSRLEVVRRDGRGRTA